MDDSTVSVQALDDPLAPEDRQAQLRRGTRTHPFVLVNSMQEDPEPARGTGWCAPSP